MQITISTTELIDNQGLRYLLLTQRGRLAGMLTKTDVYHHLNEEGTSSAKADLLKRHHGENGGSIGAGSYPSEAHGDGWNGAVDTDGLLNRDSAEEDNDSYDKPNR